MQHDDQLIGQLLTRRQALRLVAKTGVAAALLATLPRKSRAAASTTQPTLHLIATPALTEGPFFVDEKLNRSDLRAGSTTPNITAGLPLLLNFTLYHLTNTQLTPAQNLQIDLWNADITGAYSDESDPMNRQNTAGQHWLRGYQLTTAAGAASFTTIIPGWYAGRTPHIHFKIRQHDAKTNQTKDLTSQLFFTDADRKRIFASSPYNQYANGQVTNATDDIYNQRTETGQIIGNLMTLNLTPAAKGYTANFNIALTNTNFTPTNPHDRNGPPPGPPPDMDFGPPWLP